MTFPTHEENLVEFWTDQEDSLLAELRSLDAKSIEYMVVIKFYLKAQSNVARLIEMRQARAFYPWFFYNLQAAAIETEFKIRKA